MPDGQTCAALPKKGNAAAPPASPAQPQREEPTVDEGAGATEDAEGRPQQKRNTEANGGPKRPGTNQSRDT